MTTDYWRRYAAEHPTPTPEEWVRTVAADGMVMPVTLRTQHCAECSTRGDLDPADLRAVLRLLDEAREALGEPR